MTSSHSTFSRARTRTSWAVSPTRAWPRPCQRPLTIPRSDILNSGRKVVFSRTLKTADWANTTIAAGDTAEEIDKLRQGGDGHIVVWGGVGLWRSLIQLDLLDEFHVGLHPYVADEGTPLFDDVPKGYRLDLVSSTALSNGVIELQYRRHR